MKHDKHSPWVLDFDDHRTSMVERVLVYAGVACMVVSTVSEVIQAIMVLR